MFNTNESMKDDLFLGNVQISYDA